MLNNVHIDTLVGIIEKINSYNKRINIQHQYYLKIYFTYQTKHFNVECKKDLEQINNYYVESIYNQFTDNMFKYSSIDNNYYLKVNSEYDNNLEFTIKICDWFN